MRKENELQKIENLMEIDKIIRDKYKIRDIKRRIKIIL